MSATGTAVPVGLLGLASSTNLVRSSTAAATAARSKVWRRRGTATASAPTVAA